MLIPLELAIASSRRDPVIDNMIDALYGIIATWKEGDRDKLDRECKVVSEWLDEIDAEM